MYGPPWLQQPSKQPGPGLTMQVLRMRARSLLLLWKLQPLRQQKALLDGQRGVAALERTL